MGKLWSSNRPPSEYPVLVVSNGSLRLNVWEGAIIETSVGNTDTLADVMPETPVDPFGEL
jgi:hypothetical protein